jgi:hypothetical protein
MKNWTLLGARLSKMKEAAGCGCPSLDLSNLYRLPESNFPHGRQKGPCLESGSVVVEECSRIDLTSSSSDIACWDNLGTQSWE